MFEQLIDVLKRRKADIAAALAEGHASSFEVYQRLVGRYAGLQEALDVLDAILKDQEEREL